MAQVSLLRPGFLPRFLPSHKGSGAPYLPRFLRDVGLTNVALRLLIAGEEFRGESSGISHLAKNERDTPNFLQVDETRAACAPFFKERRMKFREPTKPHRKSGIWAPRLVVGKLLGRSRSCGRARNTTRPALTLFPPAPIITAGPVIISIRVSSSHLLPDALAG